MLTAVLVHEHVVVNKRGSKWQVSLCCNSMQVIVLTHAFINFVQYATTVTSTKGSLILSDCDCDVANIWVLLLSKELFTSSDAKHQPF